MTLEESTHGTIIKWQHQDTSQDEFPPFIGLSDFDVQEVVRLVKENRHGEELIVDNRRGKKQKAYIADLGKPDGEV